MRRWWLLGFMVAAAPPVARAAAADVPDRLTVDYATHYGVLTVGHTHDVFEHGGGRYRIVSVSETVGLAALFSGLEIRTESKGRVARELKPDSFVETYNGRFKHGGDFYWDRKVAVLRDGGAKATVPLHEDSWDMTSFSFNFAFVPPGADQLDGYLVNGLHFSHYRYAVVGKERLETALGPLDVIHIRKVLSAEDRRPFEMWLAPGRWYLPLRIRFTAKNGSVFVSEITALSAARR